MPELTSAWSYTPMKPTSHEGAALHIIVAGCGGTGARVVPALAKIVPAGTLISLYDPDIVERRNLLRQHFDEDDVDRLKAEVLAERYGTERLTITPYTTCLTAEGFTSEVSRHDRTILLGCTDSRPFRAEMLNTISSGVSEYAQYLWIDAGNERYTGQVAIEGRWMGIVQDKMKKDRMPAVGGDIILKMLTYAQSDLLRGWETTTQSIENRTQSYLKLTGISHHLADLVNTPSLAETPRCGERIDLQTVAVNHMAASWMICMLSNLLAGRTSSLTGIRFSVDGFTTPLRMQDPMFVRLLGESIVRIRL